MKSDLLRKLANFAFLHCTTKIDKLWLFGLDGTTKIVWIIKSLENREE